MGVFKLIKLAELGMFCRSLTCREREAQTPTVPAEILLSGFAAPRHPDKCPRHQLEAVLAGQTCAARVKLDTGKTLLAAASSSLLHVDLNMVMRSFQ